MTHSTHSISHVAAEAAAAIERAAGRATEELTVLHAELSARDAELERLQEVCDDRQRVIQELSEHAATYRRAAEDRAGLVAALDFDVQRLRADLERAERERNVALAAAENVTNELDDERQRARLLSGERDAELRAAQREAESLRARIDVIEGALTARAAVIGELQSACEARLALIERLSEEVAALQLVAEERRILLETNDALLGARPANHADHEAS